MERTVLQFEGKAAVYQKYRPDYPAACLDDLQLACGGAADGRPSRDLQIADVGAGTGIFTRQLLERGFRVAAVEPGEDMRRTLSETLGDHPRLTVYDGCAAATGLPDRWADGVTAAQAFHWFDAADFRRECRRILRPGGFAALIWNNRAAEHPLTLAAADICRTWCPAFTGFSGGSRWREASIREFFGGDCTKTVYDHPLKMDEAAFVGRYLSASYAPQKGDKGYDAYVDELTGLFRAFAKEGLLLFPNRTCCYMGRL